jgi:hypothetical protein
VAKCRVVKAGGKNKHMVHDGWRSMEGVLSNKAQEQRLQAGHYFEDVFTSGAAEGDGPPPAAS